MNVRRGDKFYSEYFKTNGTVVLFVNEDQWYFTLDGKESFKHRALSRPEELKWIYLQSPISKERSGHMTKFINYFKRLTRLFKEALKEETPTPTPVNKQIQIKTQGINPEDNILTQIHEENGTVIIKIIKIGKEIKALNYSPPFPQALYDSKDVTIVGRLADITTGSDSLDDSYRRLGIELSHLQELVKRQHKS